MSAALVAPNAMTIGTSAIRAVFAGAGVAMMGEAPVVEAVLSLTGKAPADIRLLYLGTATYDLESFRTKQTAAFAQRGVSVCSLDVACKTPTEEAVADAITEADIILVSGGNTLFAVDRWTRAKMVEPLRTAMTQSTVLCGGSAGAGCWFDALHSDSMDPDWYRELMLKGGGAAADKSAASAEAAAIGEGQAPRPWEYIRVPALGFLPGLLCPHHDRTQSNGVLRATDFNGMLRRHPGETGLAIDHFAALIVSDDEYRVLTLPGKPGSLTPSGGNEPGNGVPTCWLKTVADDGVSIQEQALPERGPLSSLLHPARAIVEDARVGRARAENPSDDVVA